MSDAPLVAERPPAFVTWMCAACGKKQPTIAGSGIRFVLGLRQRVCPTCKERRS